MKITKTYEPNNYEPKIYALWEANGAFKPKNIGPTYSIVMPPPNANGNLHIGHGLMAALEDILVRFHRMSGFDAVYLPGADHAGFETWVVYERLLSKEGKSRFDFSRDELYEQVWDFVSKQRGNMELQLKALGVGADWESLTFTLDDKVVTRVYQTFKRMWDEGLIYRGERIVNYSTTFQTSYADIEVNYKEEKGKIWTISYPVVSDEGQITEFMLISTTRPETLLGDVAVAVNPTDERYEKLIGKQVLVPLTDRKVPVIADDYVDPNFGTGVVKITPFHDPNDFEVGNRHDLPKIQVIGYDGLMTEEAGQYEGLTVKEAREKILEDLRKNGAVHNEREITHVVGYDYKSDEPIQPLIKEQWFIKTTPLAQTAIKALQADKINFTPKNKKNVLINYLENIRDWNISRQIPWGIPIPAFVNQNDRDDWIFDDRVNEQEITIGDKVYMRDEDTLDTWFSSAQWPFITTDYLEGGDLSRFYPNSVLETGQDILFPWVSRMVMMGLYCTNEVPFKEVYLHGMVLDEDGQKMSKSKGNVINPMDLIAEYGADAFRLGIIASRSAGQNQAFMKDKVLAGRNFCNKLWNVSRFIMERAGNFKPARPPEAFSSADHWVVRELITSQNKIKKYIDDYHFAEASEELYHSVWSTVADWYIEASKADYNEELLIWVLEFILRLAHPFTPFITETIWQTLPWTETTLATERFSESIDYDDFTATEFERLQALVSEIRFTIAELPGKKPYNLLYANDNLIDENADIIRHLAKIPEVIKTDNPRGISLPLSGRGVWLDVPARVLEEHKGNLVDKLDILQQGVDKLESRLSNPNYVEKAPQDLVRESQTELGEKQQQIEKIKKEIVNL